MGYHFLNMETDGSNTCDDSIVPFQITYYYGQLTGIVFVNFAPLEGNEYVEEHLDLLIDFYIIWTPSFSVEQVPALVLLGIIDNPPQCVLDFCRTPGVTSIHMWVDTYIVDCEDAPDASVPRELRPRFPALPGEKDF